jgi:hypothetical protein
MAPAINAFPVVRPVGVRNLYSNIKRPQGSRKPLRSHFFVNFQINMTWKSKHQTANYANYANAANYCFAKFEKLARQLAIGVNLRSFYLQI